MEMGLAATLLWIVGLALWDLAKLSEETQSPVWVYGSTGFNVSSFIAHRTVGL